MALGARDVPTDVGDTAVLWYGQRRSSFDERLATDARESLSSARSDACDRGAHMRAGTLTPSSPRPRSSVAPMSAHNASREDR